MKQGSLSICLFGSHVFRCDGKPYELGIRGTTLDLLRYLVVNAGRELRRECVADQFWRNSSESRQRSALNSAIWRIGKKLPRDTGINLHLTGATICFEVAEHIPVDIVALNKLVHVTNGLEGMTSEWAAQLAIALQSSEMPFLDGSAGDWALSEKERMFNIRLRGLTMLMHWYGDCRCYEDALEVGRRLLTADPFRETVQIDMMWLYVLNGQRAQALKQFHIFADLLAKELDIEPMTETRALYDHIKCDLNCGWVPEIMSAQAGEEITSQREKLDIMLVAIEQSRRELYQTLRTQLG